jgi:hypothetical protein
MPADKTLTRPKKIAHPFKNLNHKNIALKGIKWKGTHFSLTSMQIFIFRAEFFKQLNIQTITLSDT